MALENGQSGHISFTLRCPFRGIENKSERNAGIAGERLKNKKERATKTKGERKKLSRFFSSANLPFACTHNTLL